MKKLIYNLIEDISKKLIAIYEDPMLVRQYAWWMLEAITEKSRGELVARRYLILSKEEEEKLKTWLYKQTIEKMPLQYLLKSVPFCSLEILVEPPTLIPRVETEHWCSELILGLKKIKGEKLNILDLCTGSGCIALAIASSLPNSHVYATDISKRAINLTRKNMLYNNVSTIEIFNTDIYDKIPKNLKFDLIVSNPPYISMENWENFSPTIKNWEDHRALICENQGMEIIERIIKDAKKYIVKNKLFEDNNIPQICLELDPHQTKITEKILIENNFKKILILKDLFGNERVIQANL